jgi:HlyD family secretion protein
MSQVRPDIDLAGLSRPSAELPPPRRSKLRILVPLAILLAFLAVLATTVGDLWKGSVAVSVVRPTIVDASAAASAGTPLFQASGWIEPDPFPIEAPALAPGVVREVSIQPSDVVAEGQVVARLIERDAELALAAAEAVIADARAELATAESEATAARTSFDEALVVREAEAVARAEVEGAAAEARSASAAVERAQVRITVAEQELALQQSLVEAGAVGPRQDELARARLEEAKADLEVMRAGTARAKAASERVQATHARAARELELRIEDRRRLEAAKAAVDAATAKVAAAQVAADEARLRLARMEVRAPAAGVVLERLVAPGSSVTDDEPAVCTLFDPKSLRVRVDVPQGDVAKVGVGARAEVLSDSRPGKPYHGTVLRLVQKADIQKVTLQVHVLIEDEDELLRPEMLCQVRFLARGGEGAGAAAGATTAVLVPRELVVDGSKVWVVSGDGTATLRAVELGGEQGDQVVIRSGINASDKLIASGRENVTEGARVEIRER